MLRPCAIVVVLAVSACSAAPSLTEITRETVTFESVSFPGSLWDPFMPPLDRGEAVEIDGTLTLPPTDHPVPVVLITHGCGGPSDSELSWASYFASQGIASFSMNHFAGRGISTICFGEETVNVASILLDLYRAADALEDNPYIDSDRMAVLGLSFGGRTALWSALKRFRDMYDGRTFQGHMAFYPSTCFIELEDEAGVTGAPIRIFHGTADDWTPIGQCRDYVGRMTAAGADIELLSYEGAPHGFDNPGAPSPPIEIPGVSPRNCHFAELDGQIIDLSTGQPGAVGSSCVETGVHYGFDAAARDLAREDVMAFLDQIFGD